MAASVAMAEDVKCVVGNPFSALTGQPVGDPHIVEWKGRLYMFAGHDYSPESKGYDLRDWWVWSTSDLVEWKLESVLKPEYTFLRRPFRSCWATFGVPFPDGWRYHFTKSAVQIQNAPGTLDLWIVAKGGGAELCRIDWFTFRHQP